MSVIFIDIIIADKISKMIYFFLSFVLYHLLKFSQVFKVIGCHFTVQIDNNPKHVKVIQDLFYKNRWNFLQWPSQQPHILFNSRSTVLASRVKMMKIVLLSNMSPTWTCVTCAITDVSCHIFIYIYYIKKQFKGNTDCTEIEYTVISEVICNIMALKVKIIMHDCTE